jgi:hypothetical protein
LVRRGAKLGELKSPKLSVLDQADLGKMPPYLSLTAYQKKVLRSVFTTQFDLLERERVLNLPPGACDALLQGQPYKLGQWNQIEVLDAPYDVNNKDLRAAANEYIGRFLPLIRNAWQLMQVEESKGMHLPQDK